MHSANLEGKDGKEILSLIPRRHICVEFIQGNGVGMKLTVSIFAVFVIEIMLVESIGVPESVAHAKDNQREMGSAEEFAAWRRSRVQKRNILPVSVTCRVQRLTVADGDKREMQLQPERSLRLKDKSKQPTPKNSPKGRLGNALTCFSSVTFIKVEFAPCLRTASLRHFSRQGGAVSKRAFLYAASMFLNQLR